MIFSEKTTTQPITKEQVWALWQGVRSHHTITILILLFVCCSCNSEQPGESLLQEPSGDALLSVHSISAGGSRLTRGADAKPLPESVEVGFYMEALSKDGTTYYTNRNNVAGSYDADSRTWQPVAATPIWLNNRTANLAVYAPYDVTQTNPANGTLNLAASLYSEEADLISGRFTANNKTMTESPVSVTLEHLYARVVFTFIKNSTYTDAVTLGKIEWTGKDLYKTATYELFSASPATAYTIPATDANRNLAFEISPGLSVGTDKTAVGAARADLLVIPTNADFTEDGTLTVTVSTTSATGDPVIRPMSVPIPKSLFAGDRRLAAGKQFNITVLLSVTELTIDSVTTTDWLPVSDGTIDSEFD